MPRTAKITTISVDPELRDEAKKRLKAMGFGLSQYCNMAMRQLVVQNKIPFDIEAPAELADKPADAS